MSAIHEPNMAMAAHIHRKMAVGSLVVLVYAETQHQNCLSHPQRTVRHIRFIGTGLSHSFTDEN